LLLSGVSIFKRNREGIGFQSLKGKINNN